MDIVTPPRTSVYLYYDRFDILIYVGITSRGTRRNAEHNSDKVWWPFVVRQDVEHYPTRFEALAREKALIQKHQPPFNVQHNPRHAEVRSAYLLFASAHAQPVALRDAVEALDQKRIWLDVHDFHDGDRLVLRSQAEDALIAHAIEMPTKGDHPPRAFGFTKNKGAVVAIDKHGPYALFTLSKGREQPIRDAYACVRLDERGRVVLRNIHVRQPGMDRPREREIRWARPGSTGRSTN